jgi:succinyl-diaminopimelate desuccinylase
MRELAVKFLEPNGLDYALVFEPPSQSFLTEPGQLDSTLTQAVREVTGITPSLSTDGGTSDARFMKEMCPVVEFGLLTATILKIDEQVSLADLAQLTAVYRRFLDLYFEEFGIFELV